MKALPFLASLLVATAATEATPELDLLQSRCAEQERQIQQLEQENERLRSLLASTASRSVVAEVTKSATAPAPAANASSPVSTTKKIQSNEAAQVTVRAGDTLGKIARRHGTTPETLAKLNGLKNPSLIRPGQKLRLPVAASATPSSEKPDAVVRGTHVVKEGDTFYSIAKRYGLSTDALQAANPQAKPTALRPGQTLNLEARKPASPAAAPTSEPAQESSAAIAKTPEPSTPSSSSSEPVANKPRIRSIQLTEETTFGAFAAAHGTSTGKLNALNGLSLNPSTVLAKGSELYVPAQP